MTAGGPPKGSIAETVQTTDGFLRHAGRDFLVVLYTAVRSLKLYPIENAQVQKALDDLTTTTKHLLDVEKEIELRLQGEFIFVNSTRLRLDLDNYASFSHILGVLRQSGIGAVRIDEGVERKQLQIFVSLLLSYAAKEVTATKVFELAQKLSDAGGAHIGVEPPLETDEDAEDEERQKEAAKRTYARSVAVTKEVINSIRMGQTANVKKVKRAVQAIVDQVLNNEASLIGLTTLRDYDEYTFTHSVNVCIFSVALGRKLGLTKLQLYDLGMAALFHDVGKSRVPLEVLNKQGGLSDEEWRIMQAHPWLGVLTLFGLRGYGEIPYRGMIVAYEHHMKTDLTGYPKSVRSRELSIYSKIVAVADGFDAATSRRAYQTVPIQPDQVLKEMWENPIAARWRSIRTGGGDAGTARRAALIPYLTAGFPTPQLSLEALRVVEAAGADLIEVGVPFSDPLADGPTIQRSTQTALDQGMTVPRDQVPADLPDHVARVRAASNLPLAVGFGLSTPAQARATARLADGVVVGSALVEALGAGGTSAAERLVRDLAAAVRGEGGTA